jgi:hypothetical protein
MLTNDHMSPETRDSYFFSLRPGQSDTQNGYFLAVGETGVWRDYPARWVLHLEPSMGTPFAIHRLVNRPEGLEFVGGEYHSSVEKALRRFNYLLDAMN